MSHELTSKIQRALDELDDAKLREHVEQYLRSTHCRALRLVRRPWKRRNLEVGWFAELLGETPEEPVLSKMRSKYGGIPYLESTMRGAWCRFAQAKKGRVPNVEFGKTTPMIEDSFGEWVTRDHRPRGGPR